MGSIINTEIETADDIRDFIMSNLNAGRRYQTDEAVYELFCNSDREFALVSYNDAQAIDREQWTRTRSFIDIHDATLAMSEDERTEAHSGAYSATQIFRSTHMSGATMLDLIAHHGVSVVAETSQEQRGPRVKTVTRYYVAL